MVRRYIDLVDEPARRHPGATAVVAPDKQLTFAELDERVGRLGGALRGRGLKPGSRVALLAANECEYLELQAACVRSGFTLVPLNFRLAKPELDYIIRDADPAVIVAGRQEEDRVVELAGELDDVVALGLGRPDRLPSYDEALAEASPDPEADPDDPDLRTTILYTSGTTGRPKGAVIDRRGMTARVFVNALELQARPDDVFQQSLPMFHIAAFLAYAYTYRGASVVMLPQFDPAGCLQTLEQEAVTSTVLVPTMIQMLLDSPEIDAFDPSQLQLIIYGGSSINPALLRRALDTFGCSFHQQYGMTETGAQAILRPEDHDPADEEILASAGTDAVTFEVRVVDDKDRPVEPGQIGEIVCTGPAVMSGYWNLPEATQETLRGGWLHTGDMGYRDQRGYLHIVDRRNDMIITGGENVYPREVELALLEHDRVDDVAVLGLPDPTWGEVVTAVVPPDGPSDEELTSFLRSRIAGYKVPRRWVRLSDLPRNVTGKVLKPQLRSQLVEAADS